MQNNRRWLSYDTFKLIVAVILVILLLLVVPRPAARPAAVTLPGGPVAPEIPRELLASLPQGYQVRPDGSGWTISAANGELLYVWDAGRQEWAGVATIAGEPGAAPPAAPAATLPTQAPAAVTATTAPTRVPTATTTPTQAATATTAPIQAPTATPDAGAQPVTATEAVAAPTAAPTAAPAAPADECGAAAPARLAVGDSARITSNLNLRSAPGIGDNLVRVNLAGATLQIIGGPQCVAYGDGVYRWWQVEAADGAQGWSAEATLNGGMYFLEPLP